MIFHNLLVNAIGNYRYFNINMNVFSIHTCGINDTILTIIYSIVYTHVVKQIPLWQQNKVTGEEHVVSVYTHLPC